MLPLLMALLIGAALLLRLWSLNDAPPWLWWDEASQGLDARDLIDGHFRVFFSRAEGKEPLYVYLTAPFVAAFDGEPFAVRVAGALTGVAMIPALYAAGRALWRERPAAGAWVGVAAAAFWVTNFWPQSINRIGFQVNTLPLILTLAVVAWLNWTYRPIRSRALFFGFLAGLVLYTYLAARITPLLWAALIITLPAVRRKALRPTWGWALLAFALTIAPLLVHFAFIPRTRSNAPAALRPSTKLRTPATASLSCSIASCRSRAAFSAMRATPSRGTISRTARHSRSRWRCCLRPAGCWRWSGCSGRGANRRVCSARCVCSEAGRCWPGSASWRSRPS